MPNYLQQGFAIAYEKIKANSKHDPKTGCMIWLGAVGGEGYGKIRCDGEDWYIHRLIFREFICSVVPEVVMHTCDNPRCWQWHHLVGGTHADNVADKVSKDRHHKGVNCHTAKLDDDKVRTIRLRLDEGVSVVVLAVEYNVARSQIIHIRDGKSWKHVR